ncbi:hypothetical protein ACHAWT_000553 [Skeletonema menzelii]
MRFHRELLLILALSTTNTIASSTSSSGHLRGPSPSVELEASHEERQLAPGNGNGCDNGNGSSSNGQGPCKGTAATATTSSPTMAVVKPPLVCDEAFWLDKHAQMKAPRVANPLLVRVQIPFFSSVHAWAEHINASAARVSPAKSL